MRKLTSLSVIIFSLLFIKSEYGSARKYNFTQVNNGMSAPEWIISEWINSRGMKVADLRGKVVIIDFFQMWCPGCNSFSIPLMHRWEHKYRNRKDIQFISIHTVFEGHSYQTPGKLREFLKRKKIKHPVGIDRHARSRKIPETMAIYGNRGTPEMAIIDKKGKIRFKRFGSFNIGSAERLIGKLLNEK